MKCSLTRVLVVAAVAYLVYNLYSVYTIFNPPSCQPKQKANCLTPAYTRERQLQVRWWSSWVESRKYVFTAGSHLFFNSFGCSFLL